MLRKFFRLISCILLPSCVIAYQVTSVNDCGPGTLREALEQAKHNDVITFDPNLSGVIVLESPLPSLSPNLVINGPIQGKVLIDGSALRSIFDIQGENVKIRNLYLTNSNGKEGNIVTLAEEGILTMEKIVIHGPLPVAPVSLNGGILVSSDVIYDDSSEIPNLLLQNAGSAFFYCGPKVQSKVCLEGHGKSNIQKDGEGTLELHMQEASDSETSLVVDDGHLFFSGAPLTSIHTFSRGQFYGTPVASTFTNGGTAGTGSAFGIISLHSNFRQCERGKLIAKVEPNGKHDLLSANGIGYIDGDLIIQMQPGTYKEGTVYPLVTCEGGIYGQFAHIYMEIPGQGYRSLRHSQLTYDEHSISYMVTSDFTVKRQ